MNFLNFFMTQKHKNKRIFETKILPKLFSKLIYDGVKIKIPISLFVPLNLIKIKN